MRSILGLLTVVLILAGCASTAPSAAGTSAFTGEVWTWDEQAGIITLRQGGQTIRVKAAPDQFRGLDLHSMRTVYGVLAGPDWIDRRDAAIHVHLVGRPDRHQRHRRRHGRLDLGGSGQDTVDGPHRMQVQAPELIRGRFDTDGLATLAKGDDPCLLVPRPHFARKRARTSG